MTFGITVERKREGVYGLESVCAVQLLEVTGNLLTARNKHRVHNASACGRNRRAKTGVTVLSL